MHKGLRLSKIALPLLCLSISVRAASLDPDQIVDASSLAMPGQWEEIEAPDTLDLAARARLALEHYYLENNEPEFSYSLYHVFRFDVHPAPTSQLTWNLPIKELRAFPWLRTMTGSEKGLDIEAAMMKTYLRQVEDDGIVYYPYGGEGVPEGSSYSYTQGMVAIAMDTWYKRDGNTVWLEWIEKVAQGAEKMAIQIEDRAYYPPESGFGKDGAWHWSTRADASNQFMPYQPPEEPYAEQQGYEGCVKYDQSACLRALVLSYVHNRDESALEMAEKVTRFMMKPGMWADTSELGYPGNEHGLWEGHYHANVTALHALFDYANAARDNRLLHIVREAYDHAIRNSVSRMGWSPFWMPPGGFNRPAYLSGWCDTCNLADMIMLAMKLTDAGMGEYWDDVESIARNQLAEQQMTSIERMRELVGLGPESEPALQRFLGGFGGAEPTVAKPLVYGCCSANGPIGLYYAWHGITRFEEGVATVNMFLNRSSEWMNVDSWIPYEGKVVLSNKKAHTALVRIPGWLTMDDVACFLNEQAIEPVASGNRLVFANLEPGDKIRLAFEIPESQDEYTMYGTKYTVSFRGPTVVDIGPRNVESGSQQNEGYVKMYPIYLRDEMKADKAPMVNVRRFSPDRVLDLQ